MVVFPKIPMNQGVRKDTHPCGSDGCTKGECCAISFIRTMTVGSGISPDLLTLWALTRPQALAGCCSPDHMAWLQIPPVGNYTPP